MPLVTHPNPTVFFSILPFLQSTEGPSARLLAPPPPALRRAATSGDDRIYQIRPPSTSSTSFFFLQGLGAWPPWLTLRKFGIDGRVFAAEFFRFGLGCPGLTWAAFSGSYDFAYLAKVLGGGCPLSETLEGFLVQVRSLFGPAVLDMKYIARFCGEGGGIRGGLEHVAALGVEQAAGRAHNSGSDSLLTCDVLRAMV